MQGSRTRWTIGNLMVLVAIAAVNALLARGLNRLCGGGPILFIAIVIYNTLVYAFLRAIRYVLVQKPGERLDAGLLVLLAMILFPWLIPCLFFPIFLMILESLGLM